MTTASFLRARYQAGLHVLPPHESAAVRAYIEEGAEPDGFYKSALLHGIESVLTWSCADFANRLAIQEGCWADWFANYQPPASFGSRLKVKAWTAMGGLSGMAE